MELFELGKTMRRWPGTRTNGTGDAEAISLSDPELVVAARTNLPAFGSLYERYRDDLLRYCHVCLGNWDDAADATHQVFTNALSGLSRFIDRDNSFRAWLFTIAHHEVIAFQRVRTRRAEESLVNHEGLEDKALTPEVLAVTGDDHERLYAMVQALPEGQRRVVQLRLAGLTDREIAVILGLSDGAVRTAQSRAVARLRDLMTVSGAQSGGRDV
jgi:RNA polymerase sigma-70 factor (ECF subfamily)